MKKIISIFILFNASFASHATPLSQSDWNEIYTNLKNSCFQNQTNAAANSGLTTGQISAFCSCVARNTADSLTAQTAAYIKSTGDASPMIQASQAAYGYCAQ